MSVIAIAAYSIYLVVICSDNKLIATIQIITIASCLIDISWLFFGMEDFVVTVTRSLIIKILTVTSILLFVKSSKDLWIYTVIMLGGTFLSQAVLWIRIGKHISFVKVGMVDILAHFKPYFVLFILFLAMSVYHYMDKTMLGLLSTYEESGYYYNSDKVVNIPLGIINGIGTVMLPRMTALFKSGDRNAADKMFVISLEGIAYVSIAMSFGIAAVANDFIPIFYGKGYDPCVLLTMMFAPILVIKSFSATVRTQFLIPLNREREFTISVIIGAIVNLILNFAMIPGLGAIGAVIATFMAELCSCIFQFYAIRKDIALASFLSKTMSFVITGIVMLICVKLATFAIVSHIVGLLVGMSVGGFIYLLISITYLKKTKSVMYEEFLDFSFERLESKYLELKGVIYYENSINYRYYRSRWFIFG